MRWRGRQPLAAPMLPHSRHSMRFIRGSQRVGCRTAAQQRAGPGPLEEQSARPQHGAQQCSRPADAKRGNGRLPARRSGTSRSDRRCVARAGGRAPARITANSTRDRTISFYGVNTKETLTIQYMKNGKHIPEAMEKINWMLRDWRKDEPTEMDPDLIDLSGRSTTSWAPPSRSTSSPPIARATPTTCCAAPSAARRARAATSSARPWTCTFPDVPVKKLRYSALIRERGGVGYYPTSATPFVHIDTDRVRAWPRAAAHGAGPALPQRPHPACARRRRADHARGRAPGARRQLRGGPRRSPSSTSSARTPKPPIQVASLAPSLPQLLSPPQLVERPPRIGTGRPIASGQRSRRWRTSRCRSSSPLRCR